MTFVRYPGWQNKKRRDERLAIMVAQRLKIAAQPTRAELRETLAQAIRNTVVLQGKIDSALEVEP